MVSGCCCKTTTVRTFEYDEDDDIGPTKNRKCTDLLFFLVFTLFLGGMVCVGYLAFTKGNMNLLRYGYDSWGNICAQTNADLNISAEFAGRDVTDRPKLFFFDQQYFMASMPNMDVVPDPDTIMVCIAECPDETMMMGSDVDAFAARTGTSLCQYDVNSYIANSTVCPELPVTPHMSLLNRCVPTIILEVAETVASSVTHKMSGDIAKTILSDVMVSWVEILYMSFISFVTAVSMIVLLKLYAGIVVWFIVIFMSILVTGAAGFCWYKWYLADQLYKSTNPTYQTIEQADVVKTWLIYSLIASGVAVVVLLVLLVMRKRIKLVVRLFKEAGNAIGRMPLLLVQPVWTLMILIAVLGVLLTLTFYMETSKIPVVKSSGYVKYELEEMMRYLRWYHLFGVIWLSAFIVACQDLSIAGAVAIWYFSRNKSNLGCPIGRSICNLIRYHIGSVALGSFLIALVRFARVILMTIQSRLKGATNKFAQFLLKMLHCCLLCFEKFLRFLNRNAYIQIAIHGTSFCEGARKGLIVVINNALRVLAINSVGTFLLFLNKIGCVAIVVMVGSVLIEFHQDVTYTWVPLTIGGAIAFLIAHCFMLVYEICLDTIFMCFCEDCEVNNGGDKPYFMSTNLMTCVSNIEMKTVSPERNTEVRPDRSPKDDRSPRADSKTQGGSPKAGSSPKAGRSPKAARKQRY